MLTNYPYGVSSFGMPVVGGITTTGAIHFVHPTLGSDANDGLSTDTPFATIQQGITASRDAKDDYVILMPSSTDYDVTATTTVDKNRIHIICPSGIGWGGMPGNSARMHMNTAATDWFTITADNVEIAGIFFKADATSTTGSPIVFSGTRWCGNIHDNFFGLYAAAASTGNYGIVGTGACNHMAIHNNYFTVYSPALNTGNNNLVAAFIGFTSGSSTRNIIRDNVLVTGVNSTIAAGILEAGTGTMVIGNYLHESVLNGGNDAGVFTLGISTGTDAQVANNIISIAAASAANAVSGGTADQSYLLNYEGHSGGTLAT